MVGGFGVFFGLVFLQNGLLSHLKNAMKIILDAFSNRHDCKYLI